jgi:arylsulfatase A-like enzyme
MLVGMAEMTYILLRVPPPRPWGSLAYAALLYGAVCGSLGSLVAAAIWSLARWLGGKRHGFRASAEGLWAGILLLLLAGLGAVIVRFRVFRDLFDETLLPMSAGGLAIQLMILILSGSIFLAGWLGLRSVLRRPRLAWVLRPWGAPLVALALLAPGLLGHALSGTRGARAAPSAVVPPAGTPNVVFVMIDTLRVDEVGAYNPEAAGRRQTPALDAFADEGVVFDQAFANASWTRPSVASAFTGRFPSSHGAVAKDDALPDAAQTLAELLRAKGYRTAGVVTNYNLAPDFNFQQGFDEYVYLTPRYFLGADDTTAKLALYQIFRLVHERWSTGAHDVDRYYQDARRVTDESLAWLDRHSAAEPDAPFFLFVQYMDPHDPYFAHDGSGDVFGHAIDPSPPHGRRDRILEVYRQEVRFTDEHLGRLLAGLRDRGLLDPSVVLVWSDHGEEFLDHGDWWHGTSLYDELVHVPLVVRLPRAAPRAGWNRPAARPGSHVRGWVSIIDLPWTVLHEAGYAPEDLARLRYQGADLFLPRERPTVFMEENHQGNVLRALRWIGDGGESWKTIEAEQIARPGLRPVELYSVAPPARPAALTSAATARRERAEVSGAQAAVLADGRRRLREVAEAARSAALARQQASTNVDQARLEALGYVQKDTAPPPPGPDAGADDADARR